jgi:hypothetical protein
VKAQTAAGFAVLSVLLVGIGTSSAQSIAEDVRQGCNEEISAYCGAVTPGEGRLVACLYAHEDKLSGRCDWALYDAAVRLERAATAVSFVVVECRADIATHCAGVQAGERRIAECLKEHKGELKTSCRQALADIGVK